MHYEFTFTYLQLLKLFELRVLKIQKVKPDFSARRLARSRQYLYRIALIDPSAKDSSQNNDDEINLGHPINMFDLDFYTIIR